MKSVFTLMLTAALLLGVSAAAEKRKVEPLLLPMPLYNQHDYAEPVFAWNEQEVTVEESGCGAACVAMVVGYFEPDDAPEPDDVMSLAGELGLYRGDGLGRDALRLLLDEYKRLQVQLQMSMVGAAGQMPGEDMQRFQQLASLLYMNSDVQAYLMAEMQMQKTLADVFKILTEAAGIHFDVPEKQ